MQQNDLSRSHIPFKQDNTLVAVIELSSKSWLLAGLMPGLKRQPRKSLSTDPERLLGQLHRWRDEAVKAGHAIERIVVGPYSVVFSPDGRRIAVGNHQKAGVAVVSGNDLPRFIDFPFTVGRVGSTESFTARPGASRYAKPTRPPAASRPPRTCRSPRC